MSKANQSVRIHVLLNELDRGKAILQQLVTTVT